MAMNSHLFQFAENVKCRGIFQELIGWDRSQVKREKENSLPLVYVLQKTCNKAFHVSRAVTTKNVQKSLMHVQSSCVS